MVPFDTTSHGVFKPHLGASYFDGLTLKLVPFDPAITDYHARNAWWLAELCRVMYRSSVGEAGLVMPDRSTLLLNAGLKEVAFFNVNGTQAALVAAPNFHVLVFRGTEEIVNWLHNLDSLFDPWEGGGKVHRGFKGELENVWKPIAEALKGVSGPLFLAGHSLGAALAILAGARLGRDGKARAVYAYGSPRAGNGAFVTRYPKKTQVHRIVNDNDVVALVPPSLLGFEHVGQARRITEDGRITGDRAFDGVMILRRLARVLPQLVAKQDIPLPDFLTDHAPQNYVAWMQRLA